MLGMAGQAVLREDVLHRVVGRRGENRLPDPDAWIGCRLPSFTSIRMISRHWTWPMNTTS